MYRCKKKDHMDAMRLDSDVKATETGYPIDLPVFRLVVAGGRDFSNYALLCEKCDLLLRDKRNSHRIEIVSGTARGADRLGERYASERGYTIKRFPADWDKDGNKAGPIRNAKMADNADALIVFWDGQSKGTQNMIMEAKKKGVAVRIYNM